MTQFAEDFAFLQNLLRNTDQVEPPPPTIEKFRHMLIAAANMFPDDSHVLDLLNKYAFQPITGASREFFKASRRVCLIDRADGSEATAFLVEPDLILTAAHAMMGTAGIFADPTKITVRFDDFMWSDGKPAQGATCHLETSAGGTQPEVVASSITVDSSGTRIVAEENGLDYVLLRLDRKIGNEPLPFTSRLRGWMNLSVINDRPTEGPVDVLQHPQGQLLRVGRGFVDDAPGLNDKRFQYRAITRLASSGAPVLDSGKRLIGMHVAASANGIATGIVIKQIFDDLHRKGIQLLPPPPSVDDDRVGPQSGARIRRRRPQPSP
jgi:hypothetical protein